MSTTVELPVSGPSEREPSSRDVSTMTSVGGVLGVCFVAVMIASGIARGELPVWDDPVEVLRDFWEQDGQRYLASKYVFSLAAAVFVPGFLVALTTTLDRGRADERALLRLVLVAGITHTTMVFAADAAWATLASSADRLSDDSLVMLMLLDRGAYQATGFTAGMFVLAMSIAIIRTGRFPRWLGYGGLIAALGLFLSPLSILADQPESPFVLIGFVASLYLMLMILVLSVQIVRMGRPRALAHSDG